MQRAMGIDDSPEHFADDLMSSAYCGHPGRIECLALEALPTFEWLTNEIGVRWVMDAVGSEIEQSVPRSAIVAGFWTEHGHWMRSLRSMKNSCTSLREKLMTALR